MTPVTTSLVITSTLPPAVTPASSETPHPLPPQPTLPPADGVTSTQVNVRAQPSTASDVLGIIPAETRVEITGKDPAEHWWQINYPAGVDGKGWVTAEYVITANAAGIPTLGSTLGGPSDGNIAVIQQQINVRSGPGTDFNSLGTLNPQDVVKLIGKDANGAWLQIDFPQGPEGKGWVNAAFVQAQGAENLPIVSESGLVVGTGTPTSIPASPTPTVLPAAADQDSAGQPVARVKFDVSGTQTLIYNGDLSSPEGDREDWIAFQPFGQFVYVKLECRGSGAVAVEVLENKASTAGNIQCNHEMKQVAVEPNGEYVLHLQANPSAQELQYTHYILTIKTRP